MKYLTSFLILSLLTTLTISQSPSNSTSTSTPSNTTAKVIELQDSTFDDITQQSGGSNPWFIKFYHPQCSHCIHLAPVWELLVDELVGKVNVAGVNCVEETGLKERFKIRGFPTLLLIDGDKRYDYSGDRSLPSLKEFALISYKTKESKAVPQYGENTDSSDGSEFGTDQMLIVLGIVLGILVLTGFVAPFVMRVSKKNKTEKKNQFVELATDESKGGIDNSIEIEGKFNEEHEEENNSAGLVIGKAYEKNDELVADDGDYRVRI